jgi:plasmid maintenance system killer protein
MKYSRNAKTFGLAAVSDAFIIGDDSHRLAGFAAAGLKTGHNQARILPSLLQLHQARSLRDLAALPGNRLEPLSGDRAGQYSIRTNDQFRVCFIWRDGDAENVEITDYH